MEQELAARRKAEEAQEQAVYQASADLIDVQPDVCSTVHDELAPRGALNFRAVSALEEALARELEADPGARRVIPRDVDLDEVASAFVFSCAEFSPEIAGASLWNPGTPIDELKPEESP